MGVGSGSGPFCFSPDLLPTNADHVLLLFRYNRLSLAASFFMTQMLHYDLLSWIRVLL